ncbi:hypothetical protein Pcinc_006923 [Petrolisthes cinctipes]|uniref:Major facilitator superfamily (MFS) profile domain-containing protein n=1 Tax=Petrolisthes cinctipes TaxID=88211 RepID=A0AAE1GAF8_PETCI|nr:hypothetical protein Pcinc_006923 [Petrolisthes cinctipes]
MMEDDECEMKVCCEGQGGFQQAMPQTPTADNQKDGENSGFVMEEGRMREEQKPDGGWGWFVTMSAFCFMYMAAIPSVSFGIVFSRFLLDQGTSSSLIAWIFNLSLVCSGVFSYFTGPLVNEFGWRRVGFVSSLVFGMGMIASAFTSSAWFLLFSYSVIVGK